MRVGPIAGGLKVIELTGWRRELALIGEPLPLVGTVFIGVIDRGSNILQVRPTTLCPLSCIFCSVDAGPRSRWRIREFEVEDPGWLAEWALRVARAKNTRVEMLIDGVGDPFTYRGLPQLVRLLKEDASLVSSVAVETHGWALTKELVDELEEAGLDRVNLSIDTLDPEKARLLTGTPWYDVGRVREMAEYIARETSIDLHVTPVWVPGVNDEDVVQVVKWAYRIGAGKRWPPATIQKFNIHKYGRRPRGVKALSWSEFWRRLKTLEEETGLRVTWRAEEWGIRSAPRYMVPYRAGSRLRVRLLGRGWLRGTYLAVTLDNEWLVTVRSSIPLREGIINVRVSSVKDTIIITEAL